MSVMETLNTRRTYRRFAQKPVPQDVVDDMVEALRLSSCGANRQAVKLVVVQSPEMVKKVHPLVKWAAYLPPEQGAPKADEQPVMYLAVVQDSSIPGDLNTDTGIALANITLAAWAKGVGSCIMGAINKPALSELLGIAAPDKLAFMVALGCPTHAARVVPMTEKTGITLGMGIKRDCKTRSCPKKPAKRIGSILSREDHRILPVAAVERGLAETCDDLIREAGPRVARHHKTRQYGQEKEEMFHLFALAMGLSERDRGGLCRPGPLPLTSGRLPRWKRRYRLPPGHAGRRQARCARSARCVRHRAR